MVEIKFSTAGWLARRPRLNRALQGLDIERRAAGPAAAFGTTGLALGSEGQPYAPAQVKSGSGAQGEDDKQLNVHD
jgi:hypothetical protein